MNFRFHTRILNNYNILKKKEFSLKLTNNFFLVIQQEKGKQQLISGIENFNPAKLKHAVTQEKNVLPTKEGQ